MLKKGKAMKKKVKKRPAKKKAAKKKRTAKKASPRKKKVAKKKVATKRRVVRARSAGKRKPTPKVKPAPKKPARNLPETAEMEAFEIGGLRAKSGGQAGDLQGLSNVEGANSESLEELLEEGNSFEAEVVQGVEEAGESEGEVRTREVPEDDVPGEYLDKD